VSSVRPDQSRDIPVEVELRPHGELEAVKDFASKSAENAVRIAGVFHVYEGFGADAEVDADTMRNAIKVARWYLQEALRIMNIFDMPKEIEDAQALIDWMVREGELKIPASKVAQFGPNALRSKTPRDRVTKDLERRKYLSIVRRGSSVSYLLDRRVMERGNGVS